MISPEEGINFVSDGGFASEVIPLVEEVGAENILVLRIHRPDCSFEGDSRDFCDGFSVGHK